MKMATRTGCVFLLALVLQSWAFEEVQSSSANHRHHHKGKGKHHHHKGHHHHHGKHHLDYAAPTVDKATTKVAAKPVSTKAVGAPKALSKDEQLVAKMKALELKLAQKKKTHSAAMQKGHLLVMGPLPTDFSQIFPQAVAAATNADGKKVHVLKTSAVAGQPGVMAVDFQASPKVVTAVQSQATDPDSKLAQGKLHSFLVAKDDKDDDEEKSSGEGAAQKGSQEEATPVESKGIDIDTAMPYGDLEPFGREDTAQELTESSVKESDGMVDQLERAEVAEEKRAVFRALTRLRGAAITSFDGVARSQTGNIDEYNKVHKWRNSHPLHHLADEESDIAKWAFPDNADF